MYYPEGMKARVSPVQSIEPHRILAPTRDLNREPLGPQSRVVTTTLPLHTTTLPLHTLHYRCTHYTTAAHFVLLRFDFDLKSYLKWICFAFESPKMTHYLTSMHTFYLTLFLRYSTSSFRGLTLINLLALKVVRGEYFPTIRKPFLFNFYWHSFYLVPFCGYSISKFPGFDLWSLEVIQCQNYFPQIEISGTCIDTFSLSRTVFEIFDFKLFRVWPWPLKVIWCRKIVCEANIWLHICFYEHYNLCNYRFRENIGQSLEGRSKWRILTFWRSR